MRIRTRSVMPCVLVALSFAAQYPCMRLCRAVSAQDQNDLSAEEAQQIQAAERFLTVLEKNPRRGTALDRVYGHHVEYGSIDQLLLTLKDRAERNSDDGTAAMLLGLFESHRGADAAAADAFRKAEVARPNDALAPYYLGQSLLRIGQNEDAVTCFERALERKPQRADQLEIFQQLGRVHQRAQRREDALKVWQRLESLFPNDQRVLEQIATTLAEEGEFAQALARVERLSQMVKDDYRRVVFLVQAAELKIKLGSRSEGLAGLEATLTNLNPDSWLHRDVRRRIEEVFLKSGDQDSLVKYYETWLAAHPDDVEGMSRLARFLASSARVPEASVWMEKALNRAPSRNDLRRSFIDQLVNDQRISEAIEQYKLMAVATPNNPDVLRDWGKLVMKDKDQPQEARREAASNIWQQIVANRPTDALTAAQTADLFRQSGMAEDATALYRKAVELAPGDPQYREYLGEYYHIQKQPEQALKTWAAIAEGSQRNAVNVARLAEVYNSFGYLEQAVQEIAAACTLDPKDFTLQLKAAEYHARAEKFDAALAFLAVAETLADDDDERDSLIRQRIEVFQASQRMDDEITKLKAAIAVNPAASVTDWNLLARYHEATRDWPAATDAVNSGLSLDSQSIPALTTAARIGEASGDFGLAADINRRLAAADRRDRGDHLMNVARLEAQMGRADEALAAADELIVSAPGNTDNYEFLAQLCFRLGKSAEGLEALRKAVRINPNEPQLIMALAGALADQFRTDEAIEVYWRAFEKSEEIEDKTALTMKLAPLYQQTNQFEKLIERFQRDRREEDQRREMTICLAQAHHSSGDYGTARQELESLLSEDTRDSNLLQQLAKLCQDGGDLEAAIGYQRQLIAIAPGHETEFPLVAMLNARGDRDEATEILVRLTAREDDPARLLKSLDSLLNQSSFDAVISITEPLLSQQRDDWELLYREGVAWVMLEKPDDAKSRFERILSLTLPHETMGLFAAEEFKKAQAKAKSENLKGNRTSGPQQSSPLQFLGMAGSVQSATGLVNQQYYGGSRSTIWTPREYGTARMAAFGWLLRFESDAQKSASVTKPPPAADATSAAATTPRTLATGVMEKAQAPGAPVNAVYDGLYVAQLQGKREIVFSLCRDLARNGGIEERRHFFTALQTRAANTAEQNFSSGSRETTPQKTPLSEEDLTLMLECYDALKKSAGAETAVAAGGQIVFDSDGNAYVNVGGRYIRMGDSGGQTLGIVLAELKLAGRDAHVESLLKESLDAASSTQELGAAVQLLLTNERFEEMPNFFRRWTIAARSDINRAPKVAVTSRTQSTGAVNAAALSTMMTTIVTWTGKLAADEDHAAILEILDSSLDIATAETRHRLQVLSSQPQRRTSARTPSLSRVRWSYGKENGYTSIDFPRSNSNYLNQMSVTLLRQVYEAFKRNDVLSDLTVHLRQRVAAASPDNALYEKLYLAAVLWWGDEQDDSVELLTQVGEVLKNDPDFRFELAEIRAARGDIEDALEIVEGVVPRDQQLLQQRELAALTLAERLGDHERARAAAERLFGLRLDSTTQISLIDVMRRLALNEMADAVIARTERQAGNQPTALASLMMLYQGQGKADQAKQMAHMLLRKTVSPITSMANATNNPLRYRASTDHSRTQALQVLQQTGELKTVIAQLESQLERSPNSPRLYEQLIEFYGAMNQKDKIGQVLEQAVTARPDADVIRLHYAKHLQQSNKPNEACDHYLALMKRKPDWVTEDLYSLRSLFRQADRTNDLVAAIRTTDFRLIRQPYYIIDLASELTENEASAEIGMELLEKVLASAPHYRGNILSNFRNPKLWQNDRLYQFGKKLAVPTALQLKSNPWSGIDRIYSWSGDGEVSSHFHYLLRGLGRSDKATDLAQSLDDMVRENPDWYGGQAMLSLVELQIGKTQEARQRLESLAANESVLKAIPSDSCWLIGQELDRFPETRPLAVTLFEKALQSPSSSSNQLQYSPIQKLIKIYSDSGRKSQARDLLVRQVESATFDQYDPQYSAYQRMENAVFAAGKLVELQYPVDAVRLYRGVLDNEQTARAAAQWNGNPTDQYINQARNGITKALDSLDGAGAVEAVTRLLVVSDVQKEGIPRLDLMTSMPAIENIPGEVMDSALLKLLSNLAKGESIRTAIGTRLQTLQSEQPDDLSIAIALGMFQAKQNDPQFADTLQKLTVLVAEQPLEAVAEGRQPNSRQRRVAALSVPLWLVAREALKSEAHRDEATVLADHALEAAQRQTGLQHASAILIEWSRLLLDAGQKEDAEARLNELLRLSTQRPTRKTRDKKAEPQTGQIRVPSARRRISKATTIGLHSALRQPSALLMRSLITQQTFSAPEGEAVPPLTISQFRLAMTVAQIAAEQEMAQLSRNAVREALIGGSPVPDPDSAPVDSRGRVLSSGMMGAISTRPGMAPGGASMADGRFDTEVVTSLQKVVARWTGESYPADEVYELLKPLVFPTSRPADLLLYPDHSELRNAVTTSLGGTLVEWAKASGRLDDLKHEVELRRQNPGSSVPALVLLTQIAIAENQETEAADLLMGLSKQLTAAPNPLMLQLACHAALPAADHAELQKPAYDILTLAVRTPWNTPTPQSGFTGEDTPQAAGKLDDRVNRYLAQNNDLDSVRKFFDARQTARQAQYTRYGGDYGLYLQWNDLGQFATDAARLGIPPIAMDYLGRAVDFDTPQYPPPDLSLPLAYVADHLATADASQRYVKWRDWTMPNKDRQTIRIVAACIPPTVAADQFLKLRPNPAGIKQSDLLCNLTELLAAASEAGTIDELKRLAATAYEQKLPNADFLQALILIQQRDVANGEPLLKTLLETLPERMKTEGNRQRRTPWGDYVVYNAAVKSPAFASFYLSGGKRKFLSVLRDISSIALLTRLEIDASEVLREATGGSLLPGENGGLKYWNSAPMASEQERITKSWWVVHNDELSHITGSGRDLLYFRYPLTGDFRFSVDCYQNLWAEGDLGYGGIVPHLQEPASISRVLALGGHESLRSKPGLMKIRPAFNTAVIESVSGQLRYSLNEYLSYEEPLSGTSPWITLSTSGSSVTAFRNLRMEGNPTIPREVRLLNGNRMDGWNCSTFDERQPRHRIMAQKSESPNDGISRDQQSEPATFQWQTTASVLTATADPKASADAQSWLYYHRPLLDEETFRYDFRYSPGQTVAEPTIGRLAFQLTPEGVRTHWITFSDWDTVLAGIPADNSIEEPDCRRGPETLPLKPNDWNTVALTLRGRTIELSLNGTMILERALEPGIDTQFGFFRYQRQAAEIRNAILTGPWPTSLTPEIANDLMALERPLSPGDRRQIHAILGDATSEIDADDILKAAESMAPEAAYNYLADWVLPSDSHSNCRLYYRLTPLPASGDDGRHAAAETDTEQLRCPAIELVRIAQSTGRLAELSDRLRASADAPVMMPESDESRQIQKRNRQALQALFAMAGDDDKTALSALEDVYRTLSAGLPGSLTPAERAAEFVVAWQAGLSDRFWRAGADIATDLRALERSAETRSNDQQFKIQAEGLIGMIEARALARSTSPAVSGIGQEGSRISQWQAVPYLKAEQRWHGHRPSLWRISRGIAEHLPGETWSQLYFQSPLRGKFEITAERSTHGYRETEIVWGMHAAEPRHDLKSVRIHNVMHGMKESDIGVAVPGWEQLANWRIVVDGNRVTTFTNDVKIHEANFDTAPDPWVVLQTAGFGTHGSVRNLQIHGTPEIPPEIRPLEFDNLTGWRADTYGDWLSAADDKNAPWTRQAEELVGNLRTDSSAAARECVLTYQRPMLEDGVIEFETFYIPHKTEVHPSVGGIALLIRPDGVRLHQLTNAQYESSELSSDNESSIAGAAAKVPLKPQDWNRVRLTLTGNQLTISVNDSDVATVPVEDPPTHRFFSLFRYSDRTACRVRNLVYRGSWPTALPSIEQQQLAYRDNSAFQFTDAEVAETTVVPLQSKEYFRNHGVTPIGSEPKVSIGAAGTELKLQEPAEPKDWPGIRLQRSISHDVDITLEFTDLQMKPAKQGWGVGFGLDIRLDDAQQSVVECNATVNQAQQTSFKTQLRRMRPDGPMRSLDYRSFAGPHGTGRLRIVRIGGEMHCLIAPGNSDTFRLLETYTIGESGIDSITVQAKGSDPEAAVSVTLKQLTIRKLKSPTMTAMRP